MTSNNLDVLCTEPHFSENVSWTLDVAACLTHILSRPTVLPFSPSVLPFKLIHSATQTARRTLRPGFCVRSRDIDLFTRCCRVFPAYLLTSAASAYCSTRYTEELLGYKYGSVGYVPWHSRFRSQLQGEWLQVAQSSGPSLQNSLQCICSASLRSAYIHCELVDLKGTLTYP